MATTTLVKAGIFAHELLPHTTPNRKTQLKNPAHM